MFFLKKQIYIFFKKIKLAEAFSKPMKRTSSKNDRNEYSLVGKQNTQCSRMILLKLSKSKLKRHVRVKKHTIKMGGGEGERKGKKKC